MNPLLSHIILAATEQASFWTQLGQAILAFLSDAQNRELVTWAIGAMLTMLGVPVGASAMVMNLVKGVGPVAWSIVEKESRGQKLSPEEKRALGIKVIRQLLPVAVRLHPGVSERAGKVLDHITEQVNAAPGGKNNPATQVPPEILEQVRAMLKDLKFDPAPPRKGEMDEIL